MKKIKSIITVMAVASCVAVAITSCSKMDENSPGVEFMPDMYRSPSLETNGMYITKSADGTMDTVQSNLVPVAGTIARGFMPYPYSNTADGLELAKQYAHIPSKLLANKDKNIKEAEELYGKYCTHCHGATGAGDGLVGGKLPGPPPPYSNPEKMAMADGELMQIITYGRGLMGPHSSLLTQEERWKLVMYVRHLQYPNGMQEMKKDSTQTAELKEKKEKKK